MVFTALMAVIISQLVACGGTQLPRASNAPASAQCDAPEVATAVRDALCKGEATEIREALFSVDGKPGEASRDRLLTVLLRVWKGDRSYGIGLPWSALESVQNREVFVEYLAQGVRNQEIEAPLDDMKRFAVDMTHGAQRDTEQLQGLHLLGVLDAKDQVPLLRSLALSAEGPAIRRRYAIESLGYICAPEASEALREAEQRLGERDTEIEKAVENARATRTRLSSSWCRTR